MQVLHFYALHRYMLRMQYIKKQKKTDNYSLYKMALITLTFINATRKNKADLGPAL